MGAKARNTTMKSVKQFILGGTSSIVDLFSFFSTPTKCGEMKEERGQEKTGWRRRKTRSAGRADVHSRRNQSRFDNQFPTKTTTIRVQVLHVGPNSPRFCCTQCEEKLRKAITVMVRLANPDLCLASSVRHCLFFRSTGVLLDHFRLHNIFVALLQVHKHRLLS